MLVPDITFENLKQFDKFDFLTGLPSMSYFLELTREYREQLHQSGKVPVFIYADLSGMKFYNHKYGFATGDELLRSFAAILADCFGAMQCSRFGQDHFAVITEEKKADEGLNDLLTVWENQKKNEHLPVRIGVYKDVSNTYTVTRACDAAKIACDAIHAGYTSTINIFDADLQEDTERKQYIIDNLERAISEKWLQVFYQPIIRAVNGRVCDEECLVRWIDPEKGLLSPGYFIPILEEAELIYKVDIYVLEQALEKMKTLQSENLNVVPHSINLSRTDFNACDIVEEVRKRVDKSGFSRNLITIEITESAIGSDIKFMKEQIERFRNLGFPVWMDDFGSGYSSLDTLQSVPFDLIKFDMSFMRQFDEGDNAKIILTELMKMAIGISAETVCEGVEKLEQVEFLKEIGCVKLQGFYYEKPIPLQQLLKKYQMGRQIGFEDPDETPYYDAIGKISLYDTAMIVNDCMTKTDSGFQNYFDSIPMAIVEILDHKIRISRSNKNYREFNERTFGNTDLLYGNAFVTPSETNGMAFMHAIEKCCVEHDKTVFDDVLPDGMTSHTFIRWLADNPKTGVHAAAVAVLAVSEATDAVSYANIARALAGDYFNLFYVNILDDTFIEYTTNSDSGSKNDIVIEQHGQDFFQKARQDTFLYLHKDDMNVFLKVFTKENILESIDKNGSFMINYRLLVNDEYIHAGMKAVKMNDGTHIIIGVSSAETQFQYQVMMNQIKQEQILYKRLTALADDYLVIYTVDAMTDNYIECSSTPEFVNLGIAREGTRFFERSLVNGEKVVFSEDLPHYKKVFTKKEIFEEISRNGYFSLKYRINIADTVCTVEARASRITEEDGEKIIIGVRRIS